MRRPVLNITCLPVLLLFSFTVLHAQTVGFTLASSNGAEGVTPVQIRIDVADYGSFPVPVTVELSVVGGSTTASGGGVDYSVSTGELQFSANGAYYRDITITDDALDENSETVTLGLSFVSVGSIAPNAQHTYTINDNDAPPDIEFTSTTGSDWEGAPANLQVKLSTVSGLTATVDYTVTGGSATGGGTDYSLASGTATIWAGQTTTNISPTINNDLLSEYAETIEVTLTPLSSNNSTIGGNTVHTYTIIDNDSDPTVEFTNPTTSNSETITAPTVQVKLSAVSGKTVTVNFAAGGTATGGGTDYTLAASPLTINAGDLTGDISITVVNDALDEYDETITLTLSDPTEATLGAQTGHTYTIQDEDATPTVGFSTATANGAENFTPASFQVALSAVSGRDVSVDYAVSGGTASGGGVDYTLASNTATITAGNPNTTFTATINNDVLDEENETIIIDLSNLTNASPGANLTHTYTINDNDDPPTIQFANTTSSVGEGGGTANLGLVLSAPSGLNATVNYSVTGGTATGGGSDFTLNAGTATITADQTTTNIAVSIAEDALHEAPETVVVTIAFPGNAGLGGNTVHTLTITDNDAAPTVEFTAATSSGGEGTPGPTFELKISAVSGLDATVDYSAGGGDATGGGVDYTLLPNTATIAAGLLTTTITTTTIVDDALDEADETFTITLSNASEATIAGNTTHIYTITDNDATPTVEFSSGSSTGAESVSPVNFAVNIPDPSGLDVSVDYTLSGTATGGGTDYILADGTATISAGNVTVNVSATTVDDAIDENSETLILTLSSPVNALLGTTYPVHTYTITDNDDPPILQFSVGSSNGSESVSSVNLQVDLSAVSGLDVTYDYAVIGGGTATGGGVDYTFTGGTATISAGQTTVSIPITIVDDPYDENDETIIVEISGETNSTLGAFSTHTYTINDDDLPPTIEFATLASSGNEAVTPADLQVNLSTASQFAISVDYTVSGTATGGGADYVLADGTLNIAAGDSTGNISAVIVDNAVVESDETVVVTLSPGPVNAALGSKTTHTYTILNDDAPPVDFTVGTVAATGGADSTGYWNAGNTGLEVTVPVDNSAALTGGKIQLRAKANAGSFEDLGAFSAIVIGDLGTDKTLTVNAAEFEAITGFAEGAVITITAIITDAAGNSTTGTASATTVTVDQTLPAAFTTGPVETSGGETVTNYWNATNSGISVVVPLATSDASLAGGSIQLQAEADGAFEDLGVAVSIIQTDVDNGTKSVTVAATEASATGVEELADYSEGDVLSFKSVLTDVAGNFTTGSVSSSTLTVNETAPTAALTYSDTLANQGDMVTITVTVDEAAAATPKISIAYQEITVPATDMDGTADPAVWTYDASIPSSNDGLATVSITATDLAGNALTTGNTTNRTKLLVDNTSPGYVLSYSDSLAKAGDMVTITATIEEPVQLTPTISILFAGSGPNITDADMSMASDSIWTYVVTTPTGNDGFATVTITALDLAGNTATHISGSTNTLKVDNTPPTITASSPDSGDYVSTTAVSYALGETVASGQVTWTWESGTDDGASPHVQPLAGAELAAGAHTGVLTNAPTLVQGTAYGLEFIVWDGAGNTDTVLVTGVTYDAQAPQAALTYSDTLASEGDTVTITVTLTEVALNTPKITIQYSSITQPSNAGMSATADSLVWTYDAIIPSGNDGVVTVTITADDLAGNALTTGNITGRTDLTVDNTAPGYVLAYSDSLVKKGDDDVTITATFEESVQDTPTIAIDFAGTGADTTDAAMSKVADTVWIYILSIPSGNDGFATVTITALDLAGNAVTHISGGTNTLKVDNTPPTITPSSPVDDGFVRTTAVTYTLGETVASGQVIWTWEDNPGVSDPASPHAQALAGIELNAGDHSGILTNTPTLVQAAAYTLQFIAVDYAGNADTAALATVTYDTLAPGTPAGVVYVYDGLAATDIDSTSSTDSLTAHWTGFSDPVAGIALYEYAIGTSPGDSDIVDWTGNSTDTLVTAKNLSLVHKRRYYFSVRATDGAGNVSDSVSSDGVRIVDRPRLTVNVVQNSVISEYIQIFVIDTLAMADSIRIVMDSSRVSVTGIDTFAYVGTHKYTRSGSHSLEVTGFSGSGDTTRTSSLAMALAKQGQPWVAASVDQRFKTAGSPGSVSGDRYLLVVDSTLMGLSAAEGGAYRLGDGQFTFDQPVRVSMYRGMNEAGQGVQAIYILRSNGSWEELPSVDEGELVISWTNRAGTFRLGRRTIIVPQATSLHQNYPNPFNPTTRIVFDLGFQDGPRQHARVVIYNLLGQEVLTLYDGEASTGRYELTWQGVDARGLAAASGVYFVRLSTSAGHQVTRKMLLVR